MATTYGGFSTMDGRSLFVTPTGAPAGRVNNFVSTNPSINQYAGNIVGNENLQMYNQNTNGGGGGGGGGGGEMPLESTDSAQGFLDRTQQIINEAYNAAMGALGQYEGTLQPQFEQTKSELLGQQESQTARTREDERRKLGELTQQGERETGRTESAIAKARREANEIMTGLSARFGGGTGTGGFTGELVGREVLENIGGNRQALQYVMGQIGSSMENVKREAQLFIDNIDQQTQDLIGQARQQLNQALANIAGKRAELESAKAQMRLDALGQYQDTINSINARNTSLKQQIYMAGQEASQRLTNLTKQIVPEFQVQLDEWGNPLVKGTNITPENAGSAAQQASSIFNTLGQIVTPRTPGGEDDVDQALSSLGIGGF